MLLDRLRHQPPATPTSQTRCEEFAASLAIRPDIFQVRRLVAPLLQTGWGRALISAYRDEIVHACAGVDPLLLDEQRAWGIYQFLKSLSAGLLADGRKFDLSSSTAVRGLERFLLREQIVA
jgi:hypothetical protein